MRNEFLMMETLVVQGKIVNDDEFRFNIIDYAVFGSMLLLSALTGLYYGCKSRYCKTGEEATLREYLTGSGNMKPFPVAMSLIASYVSGVTILGTPAEIYNFGTQYGVIVIGVVLSSTAIAYIYLPVFFKLQVNSSYEYLELRFSRSVRTMASVLFVIDEIMFLPILIYVPSLAFNQVSGIDIHLVGTIVCLVCIFYTVLGGLKAVVWTDTWQIMVMFLSVIVVVVIGIIAIGGFEEIFSKSSMGERLIFFDMTPSLYKRHTFYTVIIGGFFYWTSYNSVNQTMVQRYLSLPNQHKSRISIALFTIGITFFLVICCFSGILIYATYYGCDPLAAGMIKSEDQLLPLFVMKTTGHIPGIPGLFIAGVFGAALSSLSVILNSTSMVFLEDFIKGCLRLNLTERTESIIVKAVALALGGIALGFLYVVERMGGVLGVASSLSSISAGTTCGIFTLGMLIPFSNNAGALIGSLAGALISGWVAFGSQIVHATKLVIPHKLPVSVDSCPDMIGSYVNYTEPIYPDESDVFPLYRLSYHWITPIGLSTVLIVGTIVSLITGKTDIRMIDPDLISPISQWMLPPESKRFCGTAVIHVRRKQKPREDLMKELTIQKCFNNEENPSRSFITSKQSL